MGHTILRWFDINRKWRDYPHILALRMPWVRNAWWDSFWILSGIPFGCILFGLSTCVSPMRLTFALTLGLATGHLISPILVAWSHAGYRAYMRRDLNRFIGLPLCILTVAVGIGHDADMVSRFQVDRAMLDAIYQLTDYRNPFVILMVVYIVWNAHHFGKQNFGVLSIYRRKSGSGSRQTDLIFCLATIALVTLIPILDHLSFGRAFIGWATIAWATGVLAIMLWQERCVPRLIFIATTALGPAATFWWGQWLHTLNDGFVQLGLPNHMMAYWPFMWAFVLLSVNHWLVAIGLSSHILAANDHRYPLLDACYRIHCRVMLSWAADRSARSSTHDAVVVFPASRLGLCAFSL